MSASTHLHKSFLGHPRQLFSLFSIEMFERFSFYGMQGILMIYLYYAATEGGLGIDKTVAGGIMGAYGGSVYLSTILGGWAADRVFGAERTLFYSGVTVMLGHIALALVSGVTGLICGLVLIALGSGGVKASSSSMVGSLYEDDALRPLRDAGFTIFYFGINVGGFFGPIITGWLQTTRGFHYGFGAAAIGMAIGLLIYAIGRRNLPRTGAPNPLPPDSIKIAIAAVLIVSSFIAAAVFFKELRLDNFATVLLVVVVFAVTGYFVRLMNDDKVDAEHRRYILAYIPLFSAMCIFWALWFQIYTAFTVYFDETMAAKRNLGWFVIPVSWKDSLQSLWVIIFSGIMAAVWTKLGARQPKTPLKFALSLFVLSLSYLIFIPFLMGGTVMPLFVLALAVLFNTLAELLLSPISLSFVTRIAPEHFKTQMVALNFLSLSLGFTLGGKYFSTCYQAENPASFYVLTTLIAIATGLVLLVMVPMLNKMLKGAE